MHSRQVPGSVFLSHSTKDVEAANRLCSLLEERGLSCWIAPRDVRPGSSYGEEIVRGIEEADVLVLILSENANGSRAVANEVERAFSHKKTIIPVRIAPVTPSKALEFFVSTCQWVDAFGKAGLAQAATELADNILAQTKDPAATTPGPPAAAAKGRFSRSRVLVAAACFVAVLSLVPWVRRGRGPAVPAPPAASGGVHRGEMNEGLRYSAVVVGINDYGDFEGQGWNDLQAARGDAEAIAGALESGYGFSVTRLLDGDATRGALIAELDALSRMGPNDAVLVYFAGHGYFDKQMGEGYWIPSDARRTAGGRPAKGDWVWNSTITRILGASGARHILVVADSCYGGSLFRGEDAVLSEADAHWYRKAIETPSRYLIASGDLEPVLDSDGQHSAFARGILNFLRHDERRVFSSSELGLSLRTSVSATTGQMVQVGPLAVGSHAGGEFVFVRKGCAPELLASAMVPGRMGIRRDAGDTAVPPDRAERQRRLQDALMLGRDGATNAAQRIVGLFARQDNEDRVTQAVVAYLNQQSRKQARDNLRRLIDVLEKRKRAAADAGPAAPVTARPRVLACVGPAARQGGAESEGLALLYRVCLRSALEAQGGVQIVEREALEELLRELDIGSSDLSDAKGRLAIGRVLPAGTLLLGDLLSLDGKTRLFLRLADTETTRVLGSFTANPGEGEDVAAVCSDLAEQVVKKLAQAQPLSAPIEIEADGRARVGLGAFHGVREDTGFEVVSETGDILGRAELADVNEASSRVTVTWTAGDPPADGTFTVREIP